MTKKGIFRFKQFELNHSNTPFKIGTDGLLLGAWVTIPPKANYILDIGTGCGLVGIMLAQRTAQTKIHGIEINNEAFNEAAMNAKACPWNNRIEMYLGAVQKFNPPNKYALIVSNPPYFENSLLSANSDMAKSRHTISLSQLDLLKSVNRLLTDTGSFQTVLPYTEGYKLIEQAKSFRLYLNRLSQVQGKKGGNVERLLLSLSKTKTTISKNTFNIRDFNEGYSTEYLDLTKEFHYFVKPNNNRNE